MSPRAFITLLVVTILAAISAVALAVAPNPGASDGAGGEPLFAALGPRIGEAGKVVVDTPQYTATWENRDGQWVATDHGDYPARAGVVASIVDSLAALTTIEPKTASADWYPYIMVGDPKAVPPTGGARVTVASTGGDTLAGAVIGLRSVTTPASHIRGGTFVRDTNETQSWLAEGTVAVPASLAEWFDPLFDIPATDIVGIAVLSGATTVFEARKTDPATGLYQLIHFDESQLPPGDKVANLDAIRNMAAATVAVTLDDARASADLTVPADARNVRFTTAAGLQLDVTMVDADGATWAIFKASAAPDSAPAGLADEINARTERWAFRLDAIRTGRLATTLADLVQAPEPAPGAVAPTGTRMLQPNGMPPPGRMPVLDMPGL